MDDSKGWYSSRTIWGGIIAVGAAIAGAFGYTVSDVDQSQLMEIVSTVAAALGGVVAIWGRITASKSISGK